MCLHLFFRPSYASVLILIFFENEILENFFLIFFLLLFLFVVAGDAFSALPPPPRAALLGGGGGDTTEEVMLRGAAIFAKRVRPGLTAIQCSEELFGQFGSRVQPPTIRLWWRHSRVRTLPGRGRTPHFTVRQKRGLVRYVVGNERRFDTDGTHPGHHSLREAIAFFESKDGHRGGREHRWAQRWQRWQKWQKWWWCVCVKVMYDLFGPLDY